MYALLCSSSHPHVFSLQVIVFHFENPRFQDTILASIVILSGKVALCAIGGIFAGMVSDYLPVYNSQVLFYGTSPSLKKDIPSLHVDSFFLYSPSRQSTVLLKLFKDSELPGMFYFGCGYAGIVFVLLLTSVACLKWRNDNPGAV